MAIYNLKENSCINDTICSNCKYRKNNLLCNGIGKVCFSYDKLTGNIIDTITGKPLSIDTINKIKANFRKEDD